MASIWPCVRTTVQIELFRDDLPLSVATGSFWNHGQKKYLVSNWHVLSGRNAYTGQPIHREAATPNLVAIKISDMHKAETGKIEQGVGVRVPLEDAEGNPVWLQHPIGQRYDVAAIELPAHIKLMDSAFLPFQDDNEHMAVLPGLDAFVLGFPKGIAKQGSLPIWKRASVASDPAVLFDNLPITVVDAATREGMSGAPVFRFEPNGQLVHSAGGLSTNFGKKPFKFIGIYSGRYGAEDELAAALGRVWWPSDVDQMLNLPTQGSFALLK